MDKLSSIELTSEQYKVLLKLVALGGWMGQGGVMGSDDAIEDIQQLVLSYSKDFGMQDKVTYDKEIESFSPVDELNEEFANVIKEYEEENFWDQLIFRLSNRDALRDMEEEGLSEEDAYARFEEYVEAYEDEFQEHDMDNVGITGEEEIED
jgi:hypothetical protein